ncbi:unnamed protein product, partial [Rotaria sp. Silwood2]
MYVAVLLLFYLLPSIICRRENPKIPLRFDEAISRLREYQHVAYYDVDRIPYTITLDDMFAYASSLSSSYSYRMSLCAQDFMKLIEAAIRHDMWALKVLDSWGKPLPSGLLVGNFFWTGNYDECIQPIYLPVNKTFLEQPFDTFH